MSAAALAESGAMLQASFITLLKSMSFKERRLAESGDIAAAENRTGRERVASNRLLYVVPPFALPAGMITDRFHKIGRGASSPGRASGLQR